MSASAKAGKLSSSEGYANEAQAHEDASGEMLRAPQMSKAEAAEQAAAADRDRAASGSGARRMSSRPLRRSDYDAHFQLPITSEFPRSVEWKNKRVAAILETAASCFSRGGFTATTLADIGKELGLRKSIVHYYFASKNALVHEVQSFAYGHFLDTVYTSLGLPWPESAGPELAGKVAGDERRMPPPKSAKEGLLRLFDEMKQQQILLGLSLEIESLGRQDDSIRALRESLVSRVCHELTDYLMSHGQSPERAATLAELSYSVFYGLLPHLDRPAGGDHARALFCTYLDEISW